MPSVQPEAMAVKNPFQARSFLPAPMFCATKADRLCMTEEGISMMKDTIFWATPYPAEGMSPMLLTMELMTRKEIFTGLQCPNRIITICFQSLLLQMSS